MSGAIHPTHPASTGADLCEHGAGQTRVSVIVPTYNRANYIGECIDSLLAQQTPPHEILVIDDGSTDGTRQLIARYGPRVTYHHKENGGKPSAVNLGLTLSSGDFVWVFDDDDVALPEAISSRLAVFQANPSLDFVYSAHHLGSDDEERRIRIGRLYVPPHYEGRKFFLELMKGCFFHLGSTLVRRSAFDRIGAFDTKLLSSEDYDFQLRLAQHLRGARCDQPSFIFRQHNGLRGAASIRYAAKDRAKIFRKFDQSVGRRLRHDVSLDAFLDEELQWPAGPAQRRQAALLSRATVMGSKACLSEMLDDIASVCAESDEGLNNRLQEHCLEAISEAICVGYASSAIMADWVNFKAELKAKCLPHRVGRSVVRAMATGFRRMALGYPGSWRLRYQRILTAGRLVMQSVASGK